MYDGYVVVTTALPPQWGHRELGKCNSRGLGQPRPSRTTIAIPHVSRISGTSRCQLVSTHSPVDSVLRWHRSPIGPLHLFPFPRTRDKRSALQLAKANASLFHVGRPYKIIGGGSHTTVLVRRNASTLDTSHSLAEGSGTCATIAGSYFGTHGRDRLFYWTCSRATSRA